MTSFCPFNPPVMIAITVIRRVSHVCGNDGRWSSSYGREMTEKNKSMACHNRRRRIKSTHMEFSSHFFLSLPETHLFLRDIFIKFFPHRLQPQMRTVVWAAQRKGETQSYTWQQGWTVGGIVPVCWCFSFFPLYLNTLWQLPAFYSRMFPVSWGGQCVLKTFFFTSEKSGGEGGDRGSWTDFISSLSLSVLLRQRQV